jgi:hypothetical protein
MPAWETPASPKTGDIVTARDMNEIRDRMTHLFTQANNVGHDFPYTLDPRLLNSARLSVLVANWCHWLRVYGGGTISNLVIDVGVASGNIGLAVYASNGQYGVNTPP